MFEITEDTQIEINYSFSLKIKYHHKYKTLLCYSAVQLSINNKREN